MTLIAPVLLDRLAWIGAPPSTQPVRGLVLRFPGLNTTAMKTGPDAYDRVWIAAGAMVVQPYQDPWGWMNPATRAFVDALVEALRARHGLAATVPLISTGGSMGGHAALLFALKSPHPVAACLALWPVCDLPFHYTERPDLPRTFHHAYGYGKITAVLEENSPLHQVASLRPMPCLIVHGALDEAVAKPLHSDRLVSAMRARGLPVEYLECPHMGHGQPITPEQEKRIVDFVLAQLR